MSKLMSVCSVVGLLAMAAALSAQGQPPAPPQYPVELKVGDTAPAFALMGSDGKVHKLSDYKGKTVVLAWMVRETGPKVCSFQAQHRFMAQRRFPASTSCAPPVITTMMASLTWR